MPNPSFEDTVDCPDNLSQIENALGWSTYRPSPDYFNSCNTSSFPNLSVPANLWGFQYARTGNAYAGFGIFQTISGIREIIGVQLAHPLVVGQHYFASFYVSRVVSPTPHLNVAINRIGMHLSTVPFSISNPQPIDNNAVIFADSIITDTLNWIQIAGSFIADSAYQYLSLGNFFQDSLISFIQYDSISTTAYYYVDDIYLAADTTLEVATNYVENNSIKIFPNPAQEEVDIEGKEIQEIFIYDIRGRPCLIKEVSSTSFLKIDVSNLSKEIYFMNVKTLNGCVTKKLVIN